MEQSPKEGVKGQQVVVWGSFLPIPLECHFSAPIIALVPLTKEEQGKVKDILNAYTMQNFQRGGKKRKQIKEFPTHRV